MKKTIGLSLALAGLLFMWAPVARIGVQAQEKPKVAIPKPGVPEIMTMEGKFVRAAYNNEGYVILGYQPANRSIGEQWLLLEVGVTLRERMPDFKLTREALSLETPDGKTVPLPTVSEFRAGNTPRCRLGQGPARFHQLLPAHASRACRIGFLRRSGLSRDGV